MKSKIVWTDLRREIAELAAQGKEFNEIIALGYSKNTTSIVLNALKDGQKPKPKDSGTEDGDGTDAGTKPLVAVVGPKTAPIIFSFEQKKISLDPLELHAQYRYYCDLAKRDGGITESFSEVLTLGMQVLWVLHQNIPMTPNMLKAVFTGYK